jgi:co-chaperonin GroES (HSP10)
MTNKSGLKPLGRAVLVEPYEPEIKKSVIVMPETVKDRTAMVETRAIVIEAGPAAWDDEPAPRAMPGDKVLISKFAGAIAMGTADGKHYRIVNDRDIYCRIEVASDE